VVGPDQAVTHLGFLQCLLYATSSGGGCWILVMDEFVTPAVVAVYSRSFGFL
jgi:hypothetical protein